MLRAVFDMTCAKMRQFEKRDICVQLVSQTVLVDFKDAFYRVVLQFVYRVPATPEGLLDLVAAISMPDAVLPALRAAVEGSPIFDKSVDDDLLCALPRDARADPWSIARSHSLRDT